jgi:hypothetical protein
MFNDFSRISCRLGDNVEKYGKARQATDNKIWRIRIACWITKATDTHSEYVILIAFPRRHRLCEGTSMLRLYVRCLSCYITVESVPSSWSGCSQAKRHVCFILVSNFIKIGKHLRSISS